jgi:hypothetical protein
MNDERDEKLDNLLRSRHIEPAGADLPQRILLKARGLPQNKPVPLWQSIRDLFGEFHLPKPEYILASVLLLGIGLGFSAAPDTNLPQDDDSAYVQSFLSADEALL